MRSLLLTRTVVCCLHLSANPDPTWARARSHTRKEIHTNTNKDIHTFWVCILFCIVSVFYVFKFCIDIYMSFEESSVKFQN